jgi:predicted amidophosphoribosyltransferase
MVIPVPLHWKRKWKRGYNQAEIIAGALAHELGAALRTDILRRTRNTVSQTRLDIREKARNVAGAFEVSEQFVRLICSADKNAVLNCSDAEASSSSGTNMPRHILLVDDTFTTGSTLMACFTALRSVLPATVRISVAALGFVGG